MNGIESPTIRRTWPEALSNWGSVVCISTADFDAPLWTNKQHIMSRLAQHVPVLYVDSLGLREPRASREDLLRMARRLIRTEPRTATGASGASLGQGTPTVVAPRLVPLHRNRWQRHLNRLLLQRSLGPMIDRLPTPRLLWTYNPAVVDELSLKAFGTLVYHCVDDLASVPRVHPDSISQTEPRLVSSADVVFASSDALADRLRRLAPQKVRLTRNVADFDHFSLARAPGEIPPDMRAIPSPRAIFVGALSDHKLDWSLLAELATLRPNLSLVLIGPDGSEQAGHGRRRLESLENVHFLGYRAYADLPSYLRGADLALIPYQVTEHTAAVFPLKTWEYLAAGLPVVATPLPALMAAQAPVTIAATADDFAAAVDADWPAASDRIASAANATWDSLLDSMFESIPRPAERVRTGPRSVPSRQPGRDS